MLADQVKSDLVAAMKAQNALKLSTLRMVQSAIGYKKIELQHDLTDAEVLQVIANEAKKRREAIASYTQAQRPDQAAQEQQELDILSVYLPAQMGEDEVKAEIAKLQLPADFGAAMREVSPMFKGKADGSLVARLVKEKLGNG